MKLKTTLVLILATFGMLSCSKDDVPGLEPVDSERTIFVYMPESGNLFHFFQQNLNDLRTSIIDNRIRTDRFIVFLAKSVSEADLFEIKYNNGDCIDIPLKSYTNPAFTTTEGIAEILNDVISFAPNTKYSMIIGCHGRGWIPVGSSSRSAEMESYGEYESMTRWFGGTTNSTRTNVSTLVDAIKQVGVKMEYILFDDCYMSSVEVAYELKDVTGHLIACPTELLNYGFPYHLMGKHMTGTVNYEGVAEAFYQFYLAYIHPERGHMPYGTIAVTDCSQMANLALIMKEINQRFTFDVSKIGEIQQMDGERPRVIFFDYGDYVSKLCTDPELLGRFEDQLELTVPSRYKRHTPQYYCNNLGAVTINAYSGVTVSDPSINTEASRKTETPWYKATH